MRRLEMRMTLAATLLAVLPLQAQVGLTIYHDGRVLVRQSLSTALPAGASTHRLALGALDPASVFALDSGVVVTGARYDESVDEVNTLRRAVGQTIKFWTGRGGASGPNADTISATVLGVNPERFKLADGRVTFQRPGTPLYPAELVLAEPTLALAIQSVGSRPSLRLGYFTQGAAWSANYSVILGRATARVSGQAAIPSQSLRVSDAEVQLLAGSVGRAPPRRRLAEARMEAAIVSKMADQSASEEEVGEAHLYTVPGRVSLEPGVTTNVSLFDPAAAPWERGYVVRGQLNYYGPLQQYGNETNEVPVEVWYTLKRQARTAFGDLPLPEGTYRIYEADQGGRLQLVGEAAAGHIAPGNDLRLPAGTAFDLTATRTQMSYTTRRDSTRTVATADYRVTIKNAKDSTVTVDVLEERGGEWSVLSSSIPAEKLSSTRTRFRVRVPGKGEATVTYRIRAVW